MTWLNQVQCFYQYLCLVDSDVLRNHPLRQAAKHIVMPHSKKTTVQQTNDRNMTERKANASAKSKEVQLNAQANSQLHNIYFCPNLTTTTFIIH
jgi:hypothetical protein